MSGRVSKISETLNVTTNANINGNGNVIKRADGKDVIMFNVESGKTLTLSNITLDGGAVWSGEVDSVLLRGTENIGKTTTKAILAANGSAKIVLNEGAIIKNNDGAIAINIPKSGGGSLTLNGAYVLDNHADGGAIWAGGKIEVNDGSKINGNSSKSIAGAIRAVSTMGSFTMNGGEINHNKAATTGGAIWGGNSANYYLNGGEIAYNSSTGGGGAIYAGAGDSIYITGDFEMHHNSSGDLGDAIRLGDGGKHSTFKMTGGKIYENGTGNGNCTIFAYNNYVQLLGGEFDGLLDYNAALYLTVGNTEITGVIDFDAARGDYKILLDKEFKGFKYIVHEDNANFSIFMLDPADDYVYTEGDEAKLICMNDGYETYWDAAAGVFKLQAVAEN